MFFEKETLNFVFRLIEEKSLPKEIFHTMLKSLQVDRRIQRIDLKSIRRAPVRGSWNLEVSEEHIRA